MPQCRGMQGQEDRSGWVGGWESTLIEAGERGWDKEFLGRGELGKVITFEM